MTPKEKAKELVDRFFIEVDSYGVTDIVSQAKAKQCVLICVDEIHKVTNYEINYWEEVKQEIEKL